MRYDGVPQIMTSLAGEFIMALTSLRPIPGIIGNHHTAWRVVFVVASLVLISGITAAFFLLIPTVNNSVKLALSEGGAVFVAVAIVPAGILSLITTVLGVRLLWRVSEGSPAENS